MMVDPRSMPVVRGCSAVLAHTPGLVPHGSKPAREIERDPSLMEQIRANVRKFDEALSYPPHQAFIGVRDPRGLPERPWVGVDEAAERFGGTGEVMPEEEFIGLLSGVDEFGLVSLTRASADRSLELLSAHPLAQSLPLGAIETRAEEAPAGAGALDLHSRDGRAGVVHSGHDEDAALAAPIILENLACKATGLLAALRLLHSCEIDPGSVDYVIGCGEEAVGDRYQRGGGNMAKAIASAAGLRNASGADVKNFCAAPIPAMVIAGSLVHAGVFRRVLVVAGGSLPKLGMKFEGHLRNGLPVLEDVLGGIAFLVEKDDSHSPRISLSSVGRQSVEEGSSNPKIMTALSIRPLESSGLRMTDVDVFATELHNPEITEPQGSGNVPDRNYRTLAALAAARGDIGREDQQRFVRERGMPGFAPTQGHLASAVCYLPHALRALTDGGAQRVQMIAKGSLFLGRMSPLSDGMSVVLERNESW